MGSNKKFPPFVGLALCFLTVFATGAFAEARHGLASLGALYPEDAQVLKGLTGAQVRADYTKLVTEAERWGQVQCPASATSGEGGHHGAIARINTSSASWPVPASRNRRS